MMFKIVIQAARKRISRFEPLIKKHFSSVGKIDPEAPINKVLFRFGNRMLVRRDVVSITGTLLAAGVCIYAPAAVKGLKKDEEKAPGGVRTYINTDAAIEERAFNDESYYMAAIARNEGGTLIGGAIRAIKNPEPSDEEKQMVACRKIAAIGTDRMNKLKAKGKKVSHQKRDNLVANLKTLSACVTSIESKKGCLPTHYQAVREKIKDVMDELSKDPTAIDTNEVYHLMRNLQLALSDRIKIDYSQQKLCDGSFEAEMIGIELGLHIKIPDGPLKVQCDNSDAVKHVNKFREQGPLTDKEIKEKIDLFWEKLDGGMATHIVRWRRYTTILATIFFKRTNQVSYHHTHEKRNQLAHKLAAWAMIYFKQHPEAAPVLIFDEEEIQSIVNKNKELKNQVKTDKADTSKWQ